MALMNLLTLDIVGIWKPGLTAPLFRDSLASGEWTGSGTAKS